MSKRSKKKSQAVVTTTEPVKEIGTWSQKKGTYLWHKVVKEDYEVKYAAHPRMYIAYGSNLNVLQMQERCATAEPITHGFLIDYALRFSNVATIEHLPGLKCPIAVWSVEPEDIGMLDRYEGFPTLYRKMQVKMTIMGKEEDCFTYILNGPYDIEPPWASYFDCLEEGYAEWGLEFSYLDEALAHAHDNWDPGLTTPTIRGKSDNTYDPYAYISKENPDLVDEWEECTICGNWDPIRLMTSYTEDGHQRYLCSLCTYYADHVDDPEVPSEELVTRQWWEESKDVASMDADDPGKQDYDPRELDYNGSFWDEQYQRPNYPQAW